MKTHNDSTYPHDRVVYFTDAVFAIVITLLAIEIKVPTHESIHDLGVYGALSKLVPLFIGFFVSFFVTAIFWRSHMELFKQVVAVDAGLVSLDIGLLAFVALMPFSTALYSENFGSDASFAFYCLNLACIGFLNWSMHVYVEKKNLIGVSSDSRWQKNKALIVPVVFLLCVPMAFIAPLFISRSAFVLIFIFQAVGNRIHSRR